MILDPLLRRQAARNFYVVCNGDCDEAIAAAVRDAMEVERAVDLLLDGQIDDEDFCDLVELRVPIDRYLTEVEANIDAHYH
ncbi:MAG: hypothetical protein HC925_00010 [Coleofasciculaceae cyanobacterium SM2_3_26]|nr:hypothetical protein [Coleofasciculaceae cyanobacterium SM2_3_26]